MDKIRALADIGNSLAIFLVQFTYGYTDNDFIHPVAEDDYGYQWPKGTPQLTKELYGYYIGGLGGHDRFFHMVKSIRLQLPTFEFVNNGIINTSALRIIKAWCDEDDVGIAGSASAGKTGPIAACVLIDWQAAPNKTLSIVCTTTVSASEDRIWGAIIKWHKACVVPIGEVIEYRKMIVWGNFDSESAKDREPNNAIKAVAVERGEEGKKSLAAFRGRKNIRVRLVFDELAEMDNYVINIRINLASNIGKTKAGDFKFYGIANPNRKDDAHGELCQPIDGWQSIDKNTPEWRTRTGKALFLSGEWSPNFLVNEDEDVPFPYLTNHRSLAKMRELCYGNTESIEFYRNAIGFWIISDTIRTILSRNTIELYGANKEPTWLGGEPIIIVGLDLGFTFGGDLCVAQLCKMAQEVSGRMVLSWWKEIIYTANQKDIFEESIARQFVDDCIKYEVAPHRIGVDISNDGGKILQAIIKYWAFDEELIKAGKHNVFAVNITAISSQGKASERPVSNVDPRPCKMAYDRRVTEYWASVREGVLSGVIKNLPLDSDLVKQFCAREYEKVKGENGDRIKLETKEVMKKRIHVSPDRPDAFTYAVEVARREGLTFITVDRFSELAQQELRRDRGIIERSSEEVAVGNYDDNSWGDDETDEMGIA